MIPKSHWFQDKFGSPDYGKCRFCGKDVRDRDSHKPCPSRNEVDPLSKPCCGLWGGRGCPKCRDEKGLPFKSEAGREGQ